MRKLEGPVQATLQELKAKHRHYLETKPAEDGYYVFETTVMYDQERQGNRKFSFYVGKILRDGTFVEAFRKRNSTRGINNLDEYLNRARIKEYTEQKEYFESEYEPLVLKELSTNPRDGVAAISKRLGMPYQTALYWIKRLEKKYGIRYTIEPVFMNRFGFFRFFAMAKFVDNRPDSEELKKFLEKNPYIQAAFMAEGAYNLFIFFLERDPASAEDLIYGIRSNKVLAQYKAHWHVSYYTQGIGYIPIRNEFFDLLKSNVWSRSKENPRKRANQIFLREYATLKELNNNGMVKFSSIDSKYGLKSGSAQYTYHKLLEDKMILRITIAMDNPPIKDTAIFAAEQMRMDTFNKNKSIYFNEVVVEEKKPLNKYIFVGDIGSPYGVILIAPLYSGPDFEAIAQKLSNAISGARISGSIITTILVGRLGYRNVYTNQTWMYAELNKLYNPLKDALRKSE